VTAQAARGSVRSNSFVAHDVSPATGQNTGQDAGAHGGHDGSRLGPLLCWAVVFADIGTSVYYTPGILFGNKMIGPLAGFFVFLTLIAFLLLSL
jgi:hypothetical protein